MSVHNAQEYQHLSDLLREVLQNVELGDQAHFGNNVGTLLATTDPFIKQAAGYLSYFVSEPLIIRYEPKEQLPMVIDLHLIKHHERAMPSLLLTFRKRLLQLVGKELFYPDFAGGPVGMVGTEWAPSLAEYSGLDVIDTLVERWLADTSGA